MDFFVIAFGIVEADRPERVDRHVLDRELVDARSVIAGRRDIEVGRVLVRVATPRGGGSDQMADRAHFGPVPKAFLKSGMVVESTSSASRTFFWLA